MSRLTVAIAWALIVGAANLIAVPRAVAFDNAPLIPDAKGESCVAPTDDMRRNHMDYIMHQRDETVVEGIRGKPFSLIQCVNCHARHDAAGKAIRIDAPGEFCHSCHGFAAVKIDCFTCHRAIPETAGLKKHDSVLGFAFDQRFRP